MADRGETARSTTALHVVFAVSSVALLLSLVWLLWADYDRPWKGFQARFREIEVQRATQSFEAMNGQQALAEFTAKERDIDQRAAALESRDGQLREMREELNRLNGQLFDHEQRKKFAKAGEDSVRYLVEIERLEKQDPSLRQDELSAAIEKTLRATETFQQTQVQVQAVENRINERLEAIQRERNALAAARRDLDQLRKRRDDLTSFTRQTLLNAPMLDFIKPSIEVKKVVLDGLFFDLNFTKNVRIDMCQTCHLPIDQPGFDTQRIVRHEGMEGSDFARLLTGMTPVADVSSGGAALAEKGRRITKEVASRIASAREITAVDVQLPQPFRSHPDLDLYLSASSPHPIESFGCTVCHRGSGESLEFVHVDHGPELFHDDVFRGPGTRVEKFAANAARVEAQKAEWEEDYHWHKQHHWDYPMLPPSYTEASCLQCHSGSLELIRDAAPTLYRGWQLIEKNGCYACHKFEGWRDDDRPGPTLVSIGEKLQRDFAYAWVSDPKSYRPDTNMPKIFHLENTIPVAPGSGTPEVEAQYARSGRDYGANVWDDVAVQSVVQFLFSRSKPHAIADPPMAGDAEKGRDQFQLAGCLACHKLGDGDDQVGKPNPYADFAPNLSGIGSKVSEKWLYAWLKEPHAWWPDTRMPNLRLADEEAANIAAYLASQQKEGWDPQVPPLDSKVLEKQARTFLESKYTFAESAAYLAEIRSGNFDSILEPGLRPPSALTGDEAVSFYVGERWISRQGCYSCHEIGGLESAQAIGAELTEWGSKEAEKLDFGLLEHTYETEKKFGKGKHPYMNIAGTPTQGREPADGLAHTDRIGWLGQKLRAPRSYDRGRDKAPLDKWRMPTFDFTEEEIHAISTYVIGCVKKGDVAPSRVMALDEPRQRLEDGWHAIRRNNCIGCHAFEMETFVFRKDDRLVEARGLVTFEDPDDEEISLQLWEPSPEMSPDSPEDGRIGAVATIERGSIVERRRMIGGGILPSLISWYDQNESKGLPEAMPFVPPILHTEGDKVRAPWLFGFMKEPYTIRPQVKVHMPNFRLSDAEANAIALYFPEIHALGYARRLALDTRTQKSLGVAELAKQAEIGGADKVRAIERGWVPPADVTEKLARFAAAQGVDTPAPPRTIEHVAVREAAYRDARVAEHPEYFEKAAEIAASPLAGNCYSCHFRGDEKPTGLEDSWAPDLGRVRERLRDDWVYRWLIDPQRIYPGTKMPAPGDYQSNFPVPREVQMRALTDLLMNWEFFPALVAGKLSLLHMGAPPADAGGK